jgi:hypothetical protein
MKTAPKDLWRIFRAIRKALRDELAPTVFDRYRETGLGPEDALDDYTQSRLPGITKDLTALLRRHRARRAGWGI